MRVSGSCVAEDFLGRGAPLLNVNSWKATFADVDESRAHDIGLQTPHFVVEWKTLRNEILLVMMNRVADTESAILGPTTTTQHAGQIQVWMHAELTVPGPISGLQ